MKKLLLLFISLSAYAQVTSTNGTIGNTIPGTVGTGGSGGGTNATFIDNEIPAGTINGSNTVFTIANPPNPVNSLQVYRNGIHQVITSDYNFTGVTITFTGGSTPQLGDVLQVYYRTAGTGGANCGTACISTVQDEGVSLNQYTTLNLIGSTVNCVSNVGLLRIDCTFTAGVGTISSLTGDVTASGSGAVAATLAASGVSAGSCGDTTHSCGLTIDAKGRVTAQSNNVIAGGGGGTSVYNTVSFSATPTFTVTSGSTIQDFKITLTGNVTSSTLSLASATSGQDIALTICQDGTGNRTFAYPANVLNAASISLIASSCSNQIFRYDGTNAVAVSAMAVSGGTPGVVIPGATSGSNTIQTAAVAGNSTTTLPSGASTTVLSDAGASNNFLTGITSGGVITKAQPTIANISGIAPLRVKTCLVVLGSVGDNSPVLADNNDAAASCVNEFGSDWSITSVACLALPASSPTVTPILSGGSSTSLITGALTCGSGVWAAGTVQSGPPVLHSMSGAGATCSSTPCSADVNINVAGGTATYIIVKITGTI